MSLVIVQQEQEGIKNRRFERTSRLWAGGSAFRHEFDELIRAGKTPVVLNLNDVEGYGHDGLGHAAVSLGEASEGGQRPGAGDLLSHNSYTTVPKSAPTPAVIAIASAPQNVTRSRPRRYARAPNVRSQPSEKREEEQVKIQKPGRSESPQELWP